MSELHSCPPATYREVLCDYLARPDESNLEQAYEFGRTAMGAGLGVLDVIRLHHEALRHELENPGPRTGLGRSAPALEAFLLEVLSPFEAAHRGFRSAGDRLQQLNLALADRNQTLLGTNAKLQEAIATAERTEAVLRDNQENLRALSAQVLTAQEDERKRISRELHDEVGQALTAVNVAVAMLKKHAGSDRSFARKVSEAEQLLAQTMETVHRFARELRPAMLDHLGCLPALRAHVTAFARRTGIRAELSAHECLEQVSGQRAEVLFRVAQEALTNVFKHAQASLVKIEIRAEGERLVMEIADNGKAFEAADKLRGRSGVRLGLVGMQERVRLVGGDFAIDSKPGRGTCVTVHIPRVAPLAQAGTDLPPSTYNPWNQNEEDIRIAG